MRISYQVRILFLSLILSFSFILAPLTASSADNICVYVDGALTTLHDAYGSTVYPFIQNGTTYIPVRGISQVLGCTVAWDGNNQNVLIYKEIIPDNKAFRNNSGYVKLYVDNEEKTLYDSNGTEVKPFIKDGTTYVPLRGVSQALGCVVEWDGSSKSVYVWDKKVSPNGTTLSQNKPYKNHFLSPYFEIDGDLLEIDGKGYTNALATGGYEEGYSLFNLNGKYKKLTFVGGSTDNGFEDLNITIIVDGEIIDKFTVEENSHSEKFTVDLDYGLQMKIILDGRYAGVGNMVFWGE